MSVVAIGAGVGILGTGLNIASGLSQQSQAAKIKRGLKDPIYNIPDEFYQNRAIAKNMAQIGLPQQQYNNQLNQINQNQSGAIQAASNSANPGAGIASIVRQGNSAGNNLNGEDAQARQNNQRYFIQENQQLGQQKLAKQQSDVFDKYTRQYNEAAALQGAGMQNVNTGLNGLTQLGGYALQYGMGNPKTQQVTQPGQTFAQQNQLPQNMWQNFGLPQQTQPSVPIGTGWNDWYNIGR